MSFLWYDVQGPLEHSKDKRSSTESKNMKIVDLFIFLKPVGPKANDVIHNINNVHALRHLFGILKNHALNSNIPLNKM